MRNVNVLCDDIGTIERNAEVSLKACKDIGLAVNTGKAKYIKVWHHRGMMANEHIAISGNSNVKVKSFKYVGSLLTNQNSIHEEIKCRLKEK